MAEDGIGRAAKGRFSSQVTEVINRNAVITLAMREGYNAFLPAYDGGIDLILYHEERDILRKVQLKSRWTIDRKYAGRGIWIAFPDGWYLMPHDEMLALGDQFGITATLSWGDRGLYSKPRPSRALIAACAQWRFPGTTDAINTATAAMA